MVVEPHLDIIALRSDNCLSAPDLFVTGIPHGRLELLGHELLWRLADAGTGRPIAQLEPLAIIAELAVEARRIRLQFQQARLPLDHDGGTRLGEGGRPDLQLVERLAAVSNRPQQRVALLEQMAVAIQFSRVTGVELGEERVEKAASALARSLDELKVVRPEQDDPKRADHVTRSPLNAVDGESPGGARAGRGRTQHDSNLKLVAISLRLHAAGDAGGWLSETNQLRRLLGPWRAGQRGQGHRLEEVGLSLRVAAEEHRVGALQCQVDLCIVPKIKE